MKYKYIASANNSTATVTRDDGSTVSTAGQPLAKVGEDVVIKRIIIGVPVSTANITIFNKDTVFATDTTGIALKYTLPTTLTASYEYPYETVLDFGEGITVDGGNVMVDQNCQLTVLYELA